VSLRAAVRRPGQPEAGLPGPRRQRVYLRPASESARPGRRPRRRPRTRTRPPLGAPRYALPSGVARRPAWAAPLRVSPSGSWPPRTQLGLHPARRVRDRPLTGRPADPLNGQGYRLRDASTGRSGRRALPNTGIDDILGDLAEGHLHVEPDEDSA